MSVTAKAESLNATITEAVEALAAETDAVKQDATFRTWLVSMSRFYNYSFGNQMLIASQCPHATRVAGYQRWQGMGRNVMKGQKAIYILAPVVTRKATEDSNSPDESKQGGKSRVLGFRATTVFDLSQTEGTPLPDAPEHNATTGGTELLPQLEAAIRAFEIQLSYQAIPGRAEGYSKGGAIVVEESQPIPAKCGTLAHELAHELLHWNGEEKGTKRQRELEAEATAYVVLNHFGMQSGSRFYLNGYGVTGEMLRASMQIIAATSRKIIEKIEGTTQEEAGDSPALPLAA